MRLPALAFFLTLALVALGLASFRSAPPPAAPDGWVMGRDFTTLLANPSLRLEVQRSGDEVLFVWRSESPARLDEAAELGEYVRTVKAALEMRDGVDAPPPDGVRTAARDAAFDGRGN